MLINLEHATIPWTEMPLVLLFDGKFCDSLEPTDTPVKEQGLALEYSFTSCIGVIPMGLSRPGRAGGHRGTHTSHRDGPDPSLFGHVQFFSLKYHCCEERMPTLGWKVNVKEPSSPPHCLGG